MRCGGVVLHRRGVVRRPRLAAYADATVVKIVVVVDDDPALLFLIEDSLALKGFEVHAFASGEDAMASDAWGGADAAVIDWMMPGVSGLEVVDWCRTAYPGVQLIMLTAAPDALLNAHPDVRDKAAVVAKTDFPQALFSALASGV